MSRLTAFVLRRLSSAARPLWTAYRSSSGGPTAGPWNTVSNQTRRGIPARLTNALANTYAKPTPIQSMALPAVCSGESAVILSETGSGKTLCYLLPIVNGLVNRTYSATSAAQVLVLTRTAELVHQTANMLADLIEQVLPRTVVQPSTSAYPVDVLTDPSLMASMRYLRCPQIAVALPRVSVVSASSKANVIIATPGALANLDLRKVLHANIRLIAIDEFDESFGDSSWRSMSKILEKVIGRPLPLEPAADYFESVARHQWIFTGATLRGMELEGRKGAVSRLHRLFPRKHDALDTPNPNPNPSTTLQTHDQQEQHEQSQPSDTKGGVCRWFVSHHHHKQRPELKRNIIRLHDNKSLGENKFQTLVRLLQRDYPTKPAPGDRTVSQTLIFTNTNTSAKKLYDMLLAHPHAHDLPSIGVVAKVNEASASTEASKRRTLSYAQFAQGILHVCVTSGAMGRGNDLRNVGHVILYDFPTDAVSYLHRIGRTARAGDSGRLTCFVTPRDDLLLKAIDEMVQKHKDSDIMDLMAYAKGVVREGKEPRARRERLSEAKVERKSGRKVERMDGEKEKGKGGRKAEDEKEEGKDGRKAEGKDGRKREGKDGRKAEGKDGRKAEDEKKSKAVGLRRRDRKGAGKPKESVEKDVKAVAAGDSRFSVTAKHNSVPNWVQPLMGRPRSIARATCKATILDAFELQNRMMDSVEKWDPTLDQDCPRFFTTKSHEVPYSKEVCPPTTPGASGFPPITHVRLPDIVSANVLDCDSGLAMPFGADCFAEEKPWPEADILTDVKAAFEYVGPKRFELAALSPSGVPWTKEAILALWKADVRAIKSLKKKERKRRRKMKAQAKKAVVEKDIDVGNEDGGQPRSLRELWRATDRLTGEEDFQLVDDEEMEQEGVEMYLQVEKLGEERRDEGEQREEEKYQQLEKMEEFDDMKWLKDDKVDVYEDNEFVVDEEETGEEEEEENEREDEEDREEEEVEQEDTGQ